MTSTTYNPQDDTVTTIAEWMPKPDVMPFKQFFAYNFVTAHLHFRGRLQSILTAQEHETCYLMADGFGNLQDIDPLIRSNIGWDWSHIRDSTPEAIMKIAEWIAKKWVGGSIDALIQQAKDDYKNLTAHGYTKSLVDMVNDTYATIPY